MVRTRMAPSPTGNLHIGTVQTTFFNYLLAKRTKGVFVLRMDDTDKVRSKNEFEQSIISGLHWLGLEWNEGPDIGGPYEPYRQSQRGGIYTKYVRQLIDAKYAYRCFCTQEELEKERAVAKKNKNETYRYSGKCRNLSAEEIETKLKSKIEFTVRMRTDFMDKAVVADQIRGSVEMKAKDVGDFIIVRSDGSPILLLTSTVDDIEMEITHAIRGEDMLNVSFRMAFIFKALNKQMPKYAHKPFMYAQDGSKLSKRHGATSIEEFKNMGYLPEAILNYLFFVGYTPNDDNKQLFSLDEMIADFDFNHFQKGMPKFDYQKLDWYNQEYIKRLSDVQLAERLKPFSPQLINEEILQNLVPLVKERLKKLAEFTDLTGFIFSGVEVPTNGWKDLANEHLNKTLETIENVKDKDWNTEYVTNQFTDLLKSNEWKTGDFFMNLRLAISGQKITPPITECMIILGKEKTRNRINSALISLSKRHE